MKKLITVLFILFTLKASSQQTELKGAAGIEFGMTKEVVNGVMNTMHKDAKFREIKKNQIFYDGGTWAGRSVFMWAFSFTDSGKLHTMVIVLNPKFDSDIFDLYKDVVEDLSGKYGPPKEDDVYELWKYPYSADDKYTHGVTAIKTGKCSFSTFYWFPGSDGSLEGNRNSIYVKITEFVSVWVKYQDGVLATEVVEKNNAAKQKDM